MARPAPLGGPCRPLDSRDATFPHDDHRCNIGAYLGRIVRAPEDRGTRQHLAGVSPTCGVAWRQARGAPAPAPARSATSAWAAKAVFAALFRSQLPAAAPQRAAPSSTRRCIAGMTPVDEERQAQSASAPGPVQHAARGFEEVPTGERTIGMRHTSAVDPSAQARAASGPERDGRGHARMTQRQNDTSARYRLQRNPHLSADNRKHF